MRLSGESKLTCLLAQMFQAFFTLVLHSHWPGLPTVLQGHYVGDIWKWVTEKKSPWFGSQMQTPRKLFHRSHEGLLPHVLILHSNSFVYKSVFSPIF